MFEGGMHKNKKKQQFLGKYALVCERCTLLDTAAKGIIENALHGSQIEYLPVSSRVKHPESAWEKSSSGRYQDPIKEITDFLGLRIVVFLESDIEKVADLVRAHFIIDDKESVNKLKPKSPDLVGYRSLHLICTLGPERSKLPEYHNLTSIRFEVQIRTVLQHAWAEIEHKKNYKGQNVLPPDLQHRLMLLAGTLELLDREFSRISADADIYQNEVSENTVEHEEDGLSAISVDVMLQRAFENFSATPPSVIRGNNTSDAVEELNDFGIKTIADFEELLSGINLSRIVSEYDGKSDVNSVGLIRDLMIVKDVRKYFSEAHQGRWQGTDRTDIEYLNEATGRTDIGAIFQEYGIDLLDDIDFPE